MNTFAMVERMPRVLFWTATVHTFMALPLLVWLMLPEPAITGVHPALKPLKFAISIALFLATMGIVLPSLWVSAATRATLAWLFALTMTAEMLPIALQALRGTTSHFNLHGSFNTTLWRAMVSAIVVASLGIVAVALLASLRPLMRDRTHELDPLLTFAWRAGLWLLVLTPISGFAMGGRLQHSVGGPDGGAGLAFLNWSTRHGDLRVAHFFAMHAVQVLPICAALLNRLPTGALPRWLAMVVIACAFAWVCVGTLAQALSGLPFRAAG